MAALAMTVRDVVRDAHGALVAGDLAIAVTGVSIDSRTVGVGEAFFAIRGHRQDGHAFLAEAAARGASCLVVHALPDRVPAGVPLVLVEDTTQALGRLAAAHRARFTLPVVAVTGSNGKTTTKELIAGVLGTRWGTLKPRASFNNQWGLPLTLLALGPEHEALVVEIATNQPGEIAALASLAAPTVGVVTTVAAVHTEFLGSLEGVREEKAGLVRAIGPEGWVVLNADDPLVAGMAREARGRVVTFGARGPADVRALDDVVEDAGSVAFTLAAAGGRVPVTLAFSGRHNVVNALAAAATGVALGLGLADIARGLGSASPVAGRCVWRSAGGVAILDDTYNANPVSVRAALATFLARPATGRRVVVLGDMLELGAGAEEAHRALGRELAARPAGDLLGVGTLAGLAVEAASAAGLERARGCASADEAVTDLLKGLTPGDAVLVKGSRGMRMERIVDALLARLARAAGGERA
jgi:UDP-N-acetylmuramoyl-tripeptide--D-alanyl-D-alanine ligase